MISRILCVATASFLGACGGPDCSPSDRDGLYMISYETISGSCTDIPDGLSRLDPDAPAPANCTVALQDLSEDECRVDVDISCRNNNGTTTRLIGYTEQNDDDGDDLGGKLTATVTNTTSGAFVCSGTYETKAERQ